jgi:hypothetical protein
MSARNESKRDWGLILIAIWLLFNGLAGLIGQALRLAGIGTYRTISPDAGFLALDTGVVVMDVFLANPVYILGGILLWRRQRWGLVLSVAGLLVMTYLMGMFAVAFTHLNAWSRAPVGDIVFLALTFPVNVLALAYLVYRYRGGRLE